MQMHLSLKIRAFRFNICTKIQGRGTSGFIEDKVHIFEVGFARHWVRGVGTAAKEMHVLLFPVVHGLSKEEKLRISLKTKN